MSKPSRPTTAQNAKAESRTFFVTSRTAMGRPIFQTDRMAGLFIDVLRNYVQARKFQVHDFVIMRDHVHLLVTVSGAMSVEKAMQLVKGSFSFRAKKELEFAGEIWQRGFSDVRVRDQESFRAHQRYLYDNPVRAGMANSPEEYPYCSLYLRRLKAQGLKPGTETEACGTSKLVP